LEVHYHPRKANVVANALSRKHWCNHLTVPPHSSCCDSEESSLWVVPHGRLNNIALIPTIKEDVIAAQRTDIGMGHIRQRLELREAQCLQQDANKVLWFRTALWFQRTLRFAARSWTSLIGCDILFIQEPTRCIKIWGRTSGGHDWSERLQSMCLNVTHVEESKPIIWDPPEIYNPWAFLSGTYRLHCGFAPHLAWL
jgi:hypothetical protein